MVKCARLRILYQKPSPLVGARVQTSSPALKFRKMSNTTNERMQKLIAELNDKAKESKLIKRIVKDANKSLKVIREVNLSRINRYTKENDLIIVPGKVLGGGELNHKLTISALKFSESAISKIEKSGSKIISIEEMTKEPTGKKIRIIG